jgi:hypothetical protein
LYWITPIPKKVIAKPGHNYAMTLTLWRPALKFLVHMATVHCQFVRHMPKWCSNITDIVIVIKPSFDWSKEMSYANGHWENPLSDEMGR